MQTNTLSSLLALDIFALIALIIAVGPITTSVAPRLHKRLLLALFYLVVVRSVYLIVFLASERLPLSFIGSAEILSLVCIIWALMPPSTGSLRRKFTRIGLGVTAICLLLVWLVPNFPWQIAVILIAFGGLLLIYSSTNKVPWYYDFPPIALGGMALLNWVGLANTGQFVALLAYGILLYLVYAKSAMSLGDHQRETNLPGITNQRQYIEQRQFREVSSALSAASGPNELLDHAVQIIGQQTQVDQVVILAFSRHQGGIGNVAAVYRDGSLLYLTARNKTTFNISDYSLLVDSLEGRRHINFTAITDNPHLKKLYALWQEAQTGPTLIQPLFLNQKGVGILILGNPSSAQPIKGKYIRLCQKLTAQLAALVVFQQEYQSLEIKAEELAAKLQIHQETRQQLTNIVETINDGVIASNTDSRIQLVNQAAEQILGRSKKQLLGRPIRVIYDDINARKSIDKLTTEFRYSNQTLTTYFEQGGQAIQGRIMPLRNNNQEWMGMVVVLRDVTAEIIADNTKNQFIKTISRELRPPLTTIKGYVDLMLVGATGNIGIQQQNYLKIIRTGTDRAIEIVNKTSRIVEDDANIIKLNLQEIDARKVIIATSKAISSLIAAKHLNLKFDIPPNLPPLYADEAKLRQILDHLLSNACRFTKEHGEISIRTWLKSEGLNDHIVNYLIIAVSDNGIGIPPAEQGRIFEPYYQVPNELSDVAGGIGLGLSVVKELVEAHSGRVWVESAVGKGSTFQVALPCASYQQKGALISAP
jgi:PAS domain S-box-containing protein